MRSMPLPYWYTRRGGGAHSPLCLPKLMPLTDTVNCFVTAVHGSAVVYLLCVVYWLGCRC